MTFQPKSGANLGRGKDAFVINLSSEVRVTVLTNDELADRRLELLVQELTSQLQVRSGVKHAAEHVGDADLWRRAARIVGKRLGIPVRTGISADGTEVWASEGP
jgi:hypothetical protein